MQKYGKCELCGTHTLTADYGFNHEYVCVECTIKDDKLCQHVTNEMIRRHGQAKYQRLVEETLEVIDQVKH